MTDTTQIRRRKDGSIDTAHYMARGRIERSRAARRMARKVTPPKGLLTVLVAVLATAFAFGKQG